MVARRTHAGRHQRFVQLLHILARGAVDDAAFRGVFQRVGGDAGQLALRLQALHAEEEVRAVEPGHRLVGVAQTQKAHDVAPHARGGRGGERRDDRTRGQLRDEVADGEVRRTEVLPPLRHAVRLVHSHERDARGSGELEEARIGKALGRHVHDLVGPLRRTAQHGGLLAGRERGVQIRPAHARVDERAHLIAHERHERADHKREAVQHDAGHLIADRLARARGHDRQRVAAAKDGRDHALLPRPEASVSEMPP